MITIKNNDEYPKLMNNSNKRIINLNICWINSISTNQITIWIIMKILFIKLIILILGEIVLTKIYYIINKKNKFAFWNRINYFPI